MKKLESTFLNMTLVLTTIALIAAGGLGAMYKVTEEPISAAKLAKQEAAIKSVLPEYDRIDEAIDINGHAVVVAYSAAGEKVGMAVETSALGFSGDLKVMVGLDMQGNIVEYSVLQNIETPGLGTKADLWFKERSDVRGRNAANGALRVSKDGGDIDAITAATISSRAFLAAVSQAFEVFAAIDGNITTGAEVDTMSGATSVVTDTTEVDTISGATAVAGGDAEVAPEIEPETETVVEVDTLNTQNILSNEQ